MAFMRMRSPLFLIWPVIFVGQLLATSLLAWQLAASVNFAYPLGYQLLDLDHHIAEFAPLNRHKKGFEFAKPEDHWRLFGEICTAVQHDGKGLSDISYQLTNGAKTPFMHSAEITHLQDVSNLIHGFYTVGIVGAFLWCLGFAVAFKQKQAFPKTRNIVLGFCGGIFVFTSMILSIGATKVFYWFHTQAFPAGHQWFFYYEDSLMTTLMKAPDIFAFIALLLISLLIILWVGSAWGMNRLLVKNTTISKTNKLNKKHKKNK
jgi:uncharacterized membrane protein